MLELHCCFFCAHAPAGVMIITLVPCRIQKDCLCFAPLIPDEVAALSVKGVSYLGNKLDLLVQKQDVSVAVRKQAENSGSERPCSLEVVLNGSGKIIPLNPGQKKTFLHKLQYILMPVRQ